MTLTSGDDALAAFLPTFLPVPLLTICLPACPPARLPADVAAMPTTTEADWDASSSSSSVSASASGATVKVKVAPGSGSSLRRLLNQSKETMIAEEKGLLRQVVELLEDVAPQVGGWGMKSEVV
jgi:hypothetical protein